MKISENVMACYVMCNLVTKIILLCEHVYSKSGYEDFSLQEIFKFDVKIDPLLILLKNLSNDRYSEQKFKI